MKLSKKVLTVALFAVLAVGFTFAEKVTLKVLNYYDMTSANAADEITVLWDAFDKANPDIQVEREDLFNEPFHQKVEAYAAAGQVPDVIYAWPSGRSSTLHSKKLLKDLRPLLAKDKLTGSYKASALANQFGGYLGELPNGVTQTHVLYVNTAVLKACGLTPAKTYDELKKQVPVLKAKGYETILMANAEQWVMQSCLFSDLAGRFGGKDWADKIIAGKAKFTDKEFVAALTFVQTLYKDGVLSKNTLATSYGDVVGQFASGKGAYYIDGDWRVGAYITDKSTGQALIPVADQKNIILTVFPDIAGAKLNKSTSVVAGTGWAISRAIPAGSAKEAAAWKLVKFLESKEIQTWRVETGAASNPSRTDVVVDASKLEPMQQSIGAFEKQYTTANYVIDGVFAGPVYDPLNQGLQELGLGTKTPEQVAAAVQKAFETWKAAQK
jgi:raffinose/stachyose/melibiose transport system substrate-binding protein